MILKTPVIEKQLYLTPNGQLVDEKREGGMEILFSHEYQKAKEKGQAAGEQLGYARAQAELASLVDLCGRLCDKLLEQRERVFDRLKPEVIELALLVAERLFLEELEKRESYQLYLHKLISHAQKLFPEEKLKVYVSSRDFEKVAELRIPRLTFHLDERLSIGDCRIETQSALVNGTLQHLIDGVRREIQEAIESQPKE